MAMPTVFPPRRPARMTLRGAGLTRNFSCSLWGRRRRTVTSRVAVVIVIVPNLNIHLDRGNIPIFIDLVHLVVLGDGGHRVEQFDLFDPLAGYVPHALPFLDGDLGQGAVVGGIE